MATVLPITIHPRTGPQHPGPGADDTLMCQFWHEMDAWHGTESNSPLHHENRCELHN